VQFREAHEAASATQPTPAQVLQMRKEFYLARLHLDHKDAVLSASPRAPSPTTSEKRRNLLVHVSACSPVSTIVSSLDPSLFSTTELEEIGKMKRNIEQLRNSAHDHHEATHNSNPKIGSTSTSGNTADKLIHKE